MAKPKDRIIDRVNLIIIERMYADPDHFGIQLKKGKDPIKALFDKKPNLYLDMVNEIWDEVHPY